MKVRIRGFRDRYKIFDERRDVDDNTDVRSMATEQLRLLTTGPSHMFMIEIEFLDELDPLQRFFRFGTDKSGMVMPVLWEEFWKKKPAN